MKRGQMAAIGFFFLLVTIVVAGVMLVYSPLPYLIGDRWSSLDDFTRLLAALTIPILFMGSLYGSILLFKPSGG